jgi:hypothetical protein
MKVKNLAEKGFEPLIDAKEASVMTGLHYSATRATGGLAAPKEGKEMQNSLLFKCRRCF